MKRMTQVSGLIVLVLLAVQGGFNAPAAARQHLKLYGISSEGILSQLKSTFGEDGALEGRKSAYRDNGSPDANAFEFLLELDFEHVAANPDTVFPEYYKITGKLFPEIGFELRLPPRPAWNRKFYMAGCGGFCGNNDTDFSDRQFTNNLNWGLRRGYAAATTDSGHSSWVDGVNQGRTYGAWATDNRRGEIDWGYRAVHEVTRVSKALIHVFYNRPARYAYFSGCSTGGRQAIMETIRYPEDFDGVISGAPALEYTGLSATWMSWIAQAMDGVTFSGVEMEAIRNRVLDQCDGIDGAVDGLIMDARRCPAVDFSGLGLSQAQLAALEKLYSKPANSLNAKLYEGTLPYGSEIYWPIWVPGAAATTQSPLALNLISRFNANFLKNMAFQEDDSSFTAGDFNFDTHPALLKFMAGIYNATDPDLHNFQKKGGKIIMYHGWADSIVPPIRTIDYYEAVVAQVGGLDKTQTFFRFFLVPGMDHCSTAQALASYGVKSVGLDDFDVLAALENWVEKGIAPDQIMASGLNLEGATLSRPLFPYPLNAKYIGGDPNKPDSFIAAKDGSVRWNRFRENSFYCFTIPALGDTPLLEGEGEGVNYFQPYDYQMLPAGTYQWQVWSPSMLDGVAYDGYSGTFEKE